MAFDKMTRNIYNTNPDVERPHSSLNHGQDMRDFHLPSWRMHHEHLHGLGIVSGLEVNGTIGGSDVIVEPGVAVDGEGRLIVLSAEGSGDIGENPPEGDNEETPVPVRLPTDGHSDQHVYITIQFSEIERTAGSANRRELVPWLRLQPKETFENDGNAIILAIAEVDDQGNLAKLEDRDSDPPFLRRRILEEKMGELSFRQAKRKETDGTIQQVESARIGPGESGGLRVEVPNAGDKVAIGTKDGSNFIASLEIGANKVTAKDADGNEALQFDADSGDLTVGTDGKSGKLALKDDTGNDTVSVTSSPARLTIGGSGADGGLELINGDGRQTIVADGRKGDLMIEGDARIGTTKPAGRLHVAGDAPPDANNAQFVITETGGKAMLLGRTSSYGFVQSHNGEPLALNPLGNTVGIGTPRAGKTFEVLGSIAAKSSSGSSATAVLFAPEENGLGSLWTNSRYNPDQHTKGWKRTINMINGNVGIGRAITAPQEKLHVDGNIKANGDIIGNRVLNNSDARFKTNLKPLTNTWEKLEKISGVSYEWNKEFASQDQSNGHREIGVIGQEVEIVFPELVRANGEEGYLTVDYGRFTAVLLEAIKELKTENEALNRRIEALEMEKDQ